VAEGVTKKASEFAVSLVFESMDFSLSKVTGSRCEASELSRLKGTKNMPGVILRPAKYSCKTQATSDLQDGKGA